MSAVDEPVKPVPSGIKPAVPAEAPQRSLFFRFFRRIRKSLEDDGLVGRVRNHFLYTTLADLRLALVIFCQFLWAINPYIAKYTASRWDRFMMEKMNVPLEDGGLTRILSSNIMIETQYYLILWWLMDPILWLVYKVLEKFTLEEYEASEREYKEARSQLGEVEADNDGQRPSLLAPLVNSRVFTWLTRAMVGYVVLMMLQDGYDIALEVAQETADYAPEATTEDLSRINPWRDLLPSQDAVLRELIYIGHVLEDLTPTTLPEDDYQLFSDLLRSLETRTDLSWRVYEETEIRNPIMHACNRKPVPDEPFNINKRVNALHRYWDGLAILPDKPGRWEDTSDTTFIPPILRGRQISDGEGGALSQLQNDDASYRLVLTPEQDAEATRVYKAWRKNRDRKVSYLKLHPPTPMAWVPVSGSNTGVSNAWHEVLPDGNIGAGRHVGSSKLVGNKKWRPMFRSLLTENIPFNWVDPADPEIDWEEELKEMNKKYERSKERRARQSEYQQVLKAELSEGKAKEEL